MVKRITEYLGTAIIKPSWVLAKTGKLENNARMGRNCLWWDQYSILSLAQTDVS